MESKWTYDLFIRADIFAKTKNRRSVLDLLADRGKMSTGLGVEMVKNGLRITRPANLASDKLTDAVEKQAHAWLRYLIWRSLAAKDVPGLESRIYSREDHVGALSAALRGRNTGITLDLARLCYENFELGGFDRDLFAYDPIKDNYLEILFDDKILEAAIDGNCLQYMLSMVLIMRYRGGDGGDEYDEPGTTRPGNTTENENRKGNILHWVVRKGSLQMMKVVVRLPGAIVRPWCHEHLVGGLRPLELAPQLGKLAMAREVALLMEMELQTLLPGLEPL